MKGVWGQRGQGIYFWENTVSAPCLGKNGWHQNYRCIDNNSMLIILVDEQGNTVIRKKNYIVQTFVSCKIVKIFVKFFLLVLIL